MLLRFGEPDKDMRNASMRMTIGVIIAFSIAFLACSGYIFVLGPFRADILFMGFWLTAYNLLANAYYDVTEG